MSKRLAVKRELLDPRTVAGKAQLNERCTIAISGKSVPGAVEGYGHSWFVLRVGGSVYEYNGNDSRAYNTVAGRNRLYAGQYGPRPSTAFRPLLMRHEQLLTGVGDGNCAVTTVAFALHWQSVEHEGIDAFTAWAMTVSEDDCCALVSNHLRNNNGNLF